MQTRAWLVAFALAATPFVAGRYAAAATYYVATDGSDSSPGTSAQPWATFAHAFAVMSGGDTLLIKDGTYDQPLRHYYGNVGLAEGDQGPQEATFEVTLSEDSPATRVEAGAIQSR